MKGTPLSLQRRGTANREYKEIQASLQKLSIAMKAEPSNQPDELLHRYFAAPDQAAEAVLSDLVGRLRPLVRGFLSRKGVRNEDLEDLCGDTSLRLVAALRNSRGKTATSIPDCKSYVLTIARNLYIDHKRRGDPWRPLHLCVIKLLTGVEPGNPFARWANNAGWMGGLALQRGHSFRPTPHYLSFWEDASLFRQQALSNRSPTEVSLAELLFHFFKWLDTPLEETEIVTHLADLRGLRPLKVQSVDALVESSRRDEENIPPRARITPEKDWGTPETEVLDAIHIEKLGAQLWEEIRQLRPLQRAAFLLGLEWNDWLKLGWSPTAVAEMLEISPEEMTAIWRDLPLPDRVIARRLGVKEEQVSNLRKCARERLRRRVPM